MTKFVLQSYKAEPSPGSVNNAAIIIDFDPPVPREFAEGQGVAGARAALEAYKAKAKATGKMVACSISVARGERSPPGFKKEFSNFDVVNAPEQAAA